jgi:hypothetical protein
MLFVFFSFIPVARTTKGERERKMVETEGGRLIVFNFYTQFSFYSKNEINPYLLGVKEGNLVFIGKQFLPLIRLKMIPTIGSK